MAVNLAPFTLERRIWIGGAFCLVVKNNADFPMAPLRLPFTEHKRHKILNAGVEFGCQEVLTCLSFMLPHP
jgi:hypothetical protein